MATPCHNAPHGHGRYGLVVRTGAAAPLLCLCAVALIRQATRAGGLAGLGGSSLFRWTRTAFKLQAQLSQAARPVLELAAALARRHRDARGEHGACARRSPWCSRPGRPDRSRETPAPRSRARPPPSSVPPMRRTPYMSDFPRPYNQPAKQPAMRSPLGELDLTRFIVHRYDAGQRLQVITALAQLVATGLKALLDGDANALDRGAGGFADADKPLEGAAVC